MTPAVVAAQKAGVCIEIYEYDHDPSTESYGGEAAQKLGVEPAAVFKTLVVETGSGKLAVAILPVIHSLNLKLLAKSVGEKKAVMAEAKLVERTTGYVLGGVSPLGQRKQLVTVIDDSATSHENIYISGGRRGFDIAIKPQDLAKMTNASFASIVRN